MAKTVIRGKGQVTIPASIRRAASLEEGDPIEVELVEDGILLRPRKVIDPTQAWFWTPEWQAQMAAAQADLEAGRSSVFDGSKALLEAVAGSDS